MRRPAGIVRVSVFKGDELIRVIESANLFVNAGRPALANLLGGDATGNFASAIGFGSGSTPPAITDVSLSTPAYYKALDTHSEDGNGSVTFTWNLDSSDTGAQGITIQELGLFADSTGVTLPGSTTPTPLLARKKIAPLAFAAGMSITGSWTLTF